MAGSSDFFGNRMPVKSTFSQTCSLLSQFMKERGSLGDLSLGQPEMFNQTGSTMNLFPMMSKPGDFPAAQNMVKQGNLTSMDLLPQQSGIGTSVPKETDRAQMTIFYGGQVIVFNDFPADKAKEVMLLATSGSSASQLAKNQTVSRSRGSVPPPNMDNVAIEELTQPPAPKPVVCDLPIARKASLQRFLEKRKDRITAKAPYQTSSHVSKHVEDRSWLGLAAQSPPQ